MSGKTILIIEDSLTVRQQISMVLTTARYSVVEASNGREGIEIVRSGIPIAMVICDVNMPIVNGLEFLETIKGDALAPPIPVLMLTTDGAPELIARAKRAGARGWIVKPVQGDLLLSAVRRVAGEADA